MTFGSGLAASWGAPWKWAGSLEVAPGGGSCVVMYYWGSGGVEWWGWLLMALGMVVFWGLVVWLIVSLVRWGVADRNGSRTYTDESPDAVLKRRFAAGEIDEDEYLRRLDVLRGRERVATH